MLRYTLIIVLATFAAGCSTLPGLVRNRAIVEPNAKKLAGKDREVPVEHSRESSTVLENRQASIPHSDLQWTPDDLMVGSAVKANVEAQTTLMSQRWEPEFVPRPTGIDTVGTELLENPSAPKKLHSADFRLKPMPVSQTDELQGISKHDTQCECELSSTNKINHPEPAAVLNTSSSTIALAVRAENSETRSTYVASTSEPSVEDAQPNEVPETTDLVMDGDFVQNSLDHLLTQLQSANRLRLNRVCLCQKVDGFGQVVEFPDAMFDAGESVLIYCEVDNFKSLPETNSSKPCHRVSLSGSFLVIDLEGNIVAEHEYIAAEDRCPSQRDDFFLVFPAQIPALQPGKYRLYLVIHDELGHDLVAHAEPIQFQIGLTGQAQR